MKKYCAIIICSLFLFAKVESQINYTVSINASNLSINTATAIDGNKYSNVSISNLIAISDTGSPGLPLKYIQLYIPSGEDVNNISITTSSETTYNLTAKVFPMQKPVLTSLTASTPAFVKPNPSIYNSSTAWPSQMVTMVNDAYFDLKNRIITLAVRPFQYYPLTNTLNFYSIINITVTLKQSTRNPIDSVKKRSVQVQSIYSNILKNIVVNPQNIPNPLTLPKPNTETTPMLAATQCSLPVYDYVIITDTSLVSSFANFINWKKRKGINIGVVTTNRIYSCSGYSSGDIISSPAINTKAGKIRQYLHDAYLNGTAWALIAGDADINVPYFQDSYYSIPTDWYFADLTSNWSGTCPLNPPNIFVGRFMCDSSYQVINWTNKVIQYEQNPGNGSYSYLLNSFSTQADQMEQGQEAQQAAAHFPNFNATIWQEYAAYNSNYDTTGKIISTLGFGQYGTTKGSEVIAKMNSHFGLVSWFCHGGTGGGNSVITPMDGGIEGDTMWQIDAHQPRTWNHPNNPAGCPYYIVTDPNTSLTALSNSNYPNVIYAVSCDVADFDITSKTGNNNGSMNLGEAYTKLPQTGGVAFLGNTRCGYVTFSTYMLENFGDLINGSDANSHLGAAEALSKYNSYDTYLAYSHNLVGCPETEMWTAIPQSLSVTTSPSDLTPFYNYSVVVTVNTIVPNGNNVTICLYKNGDIFMTYSATSDGVHSITNTFTNVDPSSAGTLNVTVTSHNYIPYQGTIPVDCIYSNTLDDITASQSWNHVTVINQNITVEPGVTLTINAPTYLNESTIFDIKSGATLIVNGSILSGCDPSYLWRGTFIGETGSIIKVNSW